MIQRIQSLVASSLNLPPGPIQVVPLSGDASDRKFYRAFLPGGETRVIMQLEAPRPSTEDPDRVPYINILRHLSICRAAVPKLDRYEAGTGILILEDMGEKTLEEYVHRFGLTKSLPLYRKAIEELLILQIIGTRKACDHCIAFQQSFDLDKLVWELDFFLEHTVQGHFGRKVAAPAAERLGTAFSELCRTIAAEPRYFTHRDYHSRNLVVRDQSIGIVDFQDARLGPLQYDLCSLLRDSYVVMPGEWVDELIAFYIAAKDRMEGTETDPLGFRRIFDLTSIQRNLKAAGTFGYMATVKKKKGYLKYLSDTFEYVRGNLNKYPELQDLRESLGTILPEIL